MCDTAPSIPVRNIYCPLSNLLTGAITIRHKNPPLTLYINDTACPVNIVASIILIARTIAASLNLYLFNTKSVTILASPNLTPGIGTSVGIADSTTNIVSAIVVSNASVVSLLTSKVFFMSASA